MKKVALFLAILMVAMAFAGCGAEAETSKVAAIKEAGQLVLGTSADYPPYEFHKMVEGEDKIVGFDIMIAQKIADEMGVELVIKDMAFDGLIAALQGGKVDMVIAGMSAKPEREEVVDFTNEYYFETQTILVKADKVDTYNSIEAFEGVKIGAQTATVQEGLAQDLLPNSPLTSLQDITALILELKTGKIEGLILVAPVAKAYITQNPELAMSIDLDQAKGVSIAVEEGSDLVDPVNEILADIMGDGTLDQYVMDATLMVD
ncbi:ABC transporter substrate-binding protein [Gottschalkiaceae bacterium SANA]|nr:ABC transporter substrate-binding protein [Gottschalkiaceae bacterium SANA]